MNVLKTFIYGAVRYTFYRLFHPSSLKIGYYKYFMDHGYTRYPYHYAAKYFASLPEIYADSENGLKYVLHSSKKLYFPSSLSNERIQKMYIALLIEQDTESSHKYVDSIEEFRDKILLDIGAAEGLISLEAVDVVNHIYLFECDPKWVEALEATFAPWKDKVSIIIKYVSDNNNGENISLDHFLKEKEQGKYFIKMDIEGAERYALEGAKNIFSNRGNVEFAISVYHKKNDKKVISQFLDRYGLTYIPREGFLYFGHSFRTGVIRGRN